MRHLISVLIVTRNSHTFWKEKSSTCICNFKYHVLMIPILTHVPTQGWNELPLLQKYTFLIIHCAEEQDIKLILPDSTESQLKLLSIPFNNTKLSCLSWNWFILVYFNIKFLTFSMSFLVSTTIIYITYVPNLYTIRFL